MAGVANTLNSQDKKEAGIVNTREGIFVFPHCSNLTLGKDCFQKQTICFAKTITLLLTDGGEVIVDLVDQLLKIERLNRKVMRPVDECLLRYFNLNIRAHHNNLD